MPETKKNWEDEFLEQLGTPEEQEAKAALALTAKPSMGLTPKGWEDEFLSVMEPKEPAPTRPSATSVMAGQIAQKAAPVIKAADTIAEVTGAKPLAKKVMFDWMQRPLHATAGVSERVYQGITGESEEELAQIPNEIWDAFSGKGKKTFSDLYFKDEPMYGLVADVVFDPLTWTPDGFFTKPLKMATESKLGSKALDKLNRTQAVRHFNRLFRPGAGTKTFMEYYDYKKQSKSWLEAQQHEILDFVRKTTKGMSDDDFTFMSYVRAQLQDDPTALNQLTPKQRSRYALLDRALEEEADRSLAAKEITQEAYDKYKGWYIPGYYRDKKKLLKTDLPPDMFDKTKVGFYRKEKTYATPVEAAYHGLDPELNLALLTGVRLQQGAVTAARKQFIEGVLEKFGTSWKKGDEIPEGYKVYFPKGKLMFYKTITIDKKFLDEIMNMGKELKKYWDESMTVTQTRTTRTRPVKAQESSEISGPLQKLVDVTKESLINRGFSENEASSAIDKLMKKGAKGAEEVVDEIIEMNTTINTLRGAVQEFKGDLFPASKFKEALAVSGKVKAYLLPDEIADDMNRAANFFDADKAASNWFSKWVLDMPTNLWKGTATSIRWPFHVRNMQTNWFQMWMGGVDNLPGAIMDAAKVQRGVGTIRIQGKAYKAEDIRKMALDNSVAGKGWMGADIPNYFINQIEFMTKETTAKKILSQTNPLNFGREFGTLIEDNARLGMFIDGLKKGMDPWESGKRVRKYLFDYSELTDFEKGAMKRVFPFYTWTRKNIPLQLEMMAEKPGRYANIAKGYTAMEKRHPETKEEKELRGEHFDKMFYQKVGNDDKGNPIYASVDLPYKEISKLNGEWSEILSSVNPVILAGILGGIMNQKVFPKTMPIDRMKAAGIKTMEDYVAAPAYIMMLPDKAKEIFKLKPIMNFDTGERDIIGMPARYRYALSILFPPLEEYDKAYPQPTLRVAEEKAPWKKLSWWTGVKFDVNDLEQQRKYRMIEQKGKMDMAYKYLMMTGGPLTEEQLNEILGSDK